eukprot:6483884-Prymnesium_polylepis.1
MVHGRPRAQGLSVNLSSASSPHADRLTRMNIRSSSMRGPQLRNEARITRPCQSAARHPELTHRSRTTSR